METPVLKKPTDRLEVIDVLRGIALFGLFSVHMQEHFELFIFPETNSEMLKVLDKGVNEIVYFLFAGKSYALFAFLFGLSFFIQMKSQADKGNDFRSRFIWRLIVLGGIGWFHSLVYSGDILTYFFIMGFVLVVMDKVPSRVLIILAVFFLLQIPFVVMVINKTLNHDYQRNPLLITMDAIYSSNGPIFSKGSLLDVLSFNISEAQKSKWLYMFLYGRVFQTLGLFMIGIVIGRSGFFKTIGKYKKHCQVALVLASTLFIPLFIFNRFYLPEIASEKTIIESWTIILSSYANFAFVVIIFSSFVLLYQNDTIRKGLDILKYIGRMSLTTYVMQSVVWVPLIYGYGAGLYDSIGFFYSFLLGIVFFVAQLFLSRWWMNRYHYGPLEWLWRSVTYLSLQDVPLKRDLVRS
ncbi:MAG: DUF418 domain-containing protein [Sporocytophaga sp.]|uniref:DUF418 domain-containing protein n=1 Tax=Sporocytophaga sp. TaxID=2231183 RepID=UPI001B0E48DA|nr:DUF418 domain-containing protein [Sporocytophaga sp.]MBO9703554.1 DUF418 domain-containing protein [Sporocytophaga sp.]